jgi:hypothetical protein
MKAEAVGATAASLQLLLALTKSVNWLVKSYRDIRNVYESKKDLHDGLVQIKVVLSVVEAKLRRPNSVMTGVHGPYVVELLQNTLQTTQRLEDIHKHISRQRRRLPKIQQYFRSQRLDAKIRHCQLRLDLARRTLFEVMVLER